MTVALYILLALSLLANLYALALIAVFRMSVARVIEQAKLMQEACSESVDKMDSMLKQTEELHATFEEIDRTVAKIHDHTK